MKPIATGLDVLQGEQHVCIGYLLPTGNNYSYKQGIK